MKDILALAKGARMAAAVLAVAPEDQRNKALECMAKALEANEQALLSANARDIEAAQAAGKKPAFIERLTLSHARIAAMAQGLREVAALPDPVHRVLEGFTRPNGLRIEKTTVPLGVIGIIYESRPNVTADAAALCLKSGNACILRGGSDALLSNSAIADLLIQACKDAGLPGECVNLVRDPSREAANYMMKLRAYIDVLIPRGGAGLIQSVIKHATIPVIETGTGNCHVYAHDGLKPSSYQMAINVIVNAKTSRPSVCNAAESLLVDESIAKDFLPLCIKALLDKGVEIRGCKKTVRLCKGLAVQPATNTDYATEYNDLILSVKVVRDLDEAVNHIARYGTHHSEAILTDDYTAAEGFLNRVDAAAVYVNASTRFTDGGVFGLSAEIGISNQKLHARGPMGLAQLTTVKYMIRGNGQCR